MLTNPPVPYDYCVGIPISCLLTVGAFSVIVQQVVEPMDRFAALLVRYNYRNQPSKIVIVLRLKLSLEGKFTPETAACYSARVV